MKVFVNRTSRREVAISLDPDGNLQVSADKKLSLDEIKQIVSEKTDWINDRLAKLRQSKMEFGESTTVRANIDVEASIKRSVADVFCGRKTVLDGYIYFVRSTNASKSYVENDSVYIPEKYCADKESRLKAIRSFIKKQTDMQVSEAISRFGSHVSLCPSKIEYRNLANAWLKCTSPREKIITLDYRICQLPQELQHYLIVHAFSHFTNAGHDEDFWNTVSNYLPTFGKCLQELQNFDFLKEI